MEQREKVKERKSKMDKKAIWLYGLAFLIINLVMSLKIFVTFSDMAAYAASKDSMSLVIERLDRIEHKLDRVIGY